MICTIVTPHYHPYQFWCSATTSKSFRIMVGTRRLELLTSTVSKCAAALHHFRVIPMKTCELFANLLPLCNRCFGSIMVSLLIQKGLQISAFVTLDVTPSIMGALWGSPLAILAGYYGSVSGERRAA